jgi:hypothetical protein
VPDTDGDIQDQARHEAMHAATSASCARFHGERPTVTGKDDWNTIAPVMLPSASVSLPRDPQHAVELLRQLGRHRRQEEREDECGR